MENNKVQKYFLLLLILLSTSISAELKTPENLAQNVISLLKANKPIDAFEMAFSENKHMQEKKADLEQLKYSFSGFVAQVGAPYDCELLISKNIKERYRVDKYLCLSEKQPFEIDFDFYKPQKEWRVQAFGYSSEIDEIINESIRIDLRKQSENNGS